MKLFINIRSKSPISLYTFGYRWVAGEELMDVVHNSKRRLGAGRSRNKAACSDQDGLLRIAVDQGRSDRRD